MRKFFLWFVVVILALSCKPERKPNIIFLLTDDQRWDALGYAGNDIIETPNMDRLASEGVYFNHAYVTTPICAVSRAGILSGQYARRHGIHGFSTHFSDSAYADTYPMLLKAAGYKIGFIGKYGVGKEEDFPWKKYDYWKCFGGQGRYWHQRDDGSWVHLTELMGDRAVDFIDQMSADTAFCLSVSFKAPHVQDGDPRQFLYDSAYAGLYENVTIPIPQTADSVYWEAFPAFFKNNNEARRRWAMRFATPEMYQQSVKGYYRLIYGIDVVIGRIRKALDDKGLGDNTVIILLGDNGFYLSEHGMAGKWYAHKESVMVPLIYYDPRNEGKIHGMRRDEIALNIDIAPTILDLAGVAVPESVQGRSLLKLINEKERNDWRQGFLFEHLFKYKTIPMSEGVIGQRYKYVRFLVDDPQNEWLFDLEKDPDEVINFADSASYEAVKDSLIRVTNEMIESAK